MTSSSIDPMLQTKRAASQKCQQSLAEADGQRDAAEARARRLAGTIDRLADEMQAHSRKSPMDVAALRQLDELLQVLQAQHRELQEQAELARQVLETCRDELQRAERSVKTLEALKNRQPPPRRAA